MNYIMNKRCEIKNKKIINVFIIIIKKQNKNMIIIIKDYNSNNDNYKNYLYF